MSESHTTTDHNKIRKWVEERDGVPTTVKETEQDGHAGILRIDFGPREQRLRKSAGTNFSRSSTRPNWRSFIRTSKRRGGQPLP